MKPVDRGDEPERHGRGRSAPADPRAAEAPPGLPRSPPCPFCAGLETEIVNAFGSQLSVATYWCGNCRSPFEFMKWTGV